MKSRIVDSEYLLPMDLDRRQCRDIVVQDLAVKEARRLVRHHVTAQPTDSRAVSQSFASFLR